MQGVLNNGSTCHPKQQLILLLLPDTADPGGCCCSSQIFDLKTSDGVGNDARIAREFGVETNATEKGWWLPTAPGFPGPITPWATQALRWAAAKSCKTLEQKPFNCALRETTEDEGDPVQKLSRTRWRVHMPRAYSSRDRGG